MPEPSVTISASIPIGLYMALEKYSEEHDMKRSRVIARALREFLTREGYLGGEVL